MKTTMADLPTGFWSGWIIVLTCVSLATLVWLIFSVYFAPSANEHPEAEPVWDNDLREGSNAPPLWWFWMLLAALVFSLIYLMLYPGLGSYKGLLNWSHGKRIVESYETYDTSFQEIRADIASKNLAEIQNDLDLMQAAERIFKRECSACHGPDARGQASLFPNLMDIDWQWGSSAEQIEQTIRGGRVANMLAWQSILGDENINQVADYVADMGDSAAADHPGQVIYQQNCVACHGVDGAGNPLLGAPNLADNIWLYGGDIETIKASIAAGRGGVMPAFNKRLDDAQIKLLVAMLAR
ncbi:MAG: cytochrome-c oxidase, cbb3-type subunit III [SAR86 cluster bacterium]|uniref:Cbb3-type cytochrome c oxidase subunit n=1 Tax=SAR86 cluster bacterium TaxID=2030880 RepID=A0A2A4X3A8_9GAMM|nr:MAG: cytochrome-c oxidase, cbb3-type subunit III [SAR86 cluster bacterium]